MSDDRFNREDPDRTLPDNTLTSVLANHQKRVERVERHPMGCNNCEPPAVYDCRPLKPVCGTCYICPEKWTGCLSIPGCDGGGDCRGCIEDVMGSPLWVGQVHSVGGPPRGPAAYDAAGAFYFAELPNIQGNIWPDMLPGSQSISFLAKNFGMDNDLLPTQIDYVCAELRRHDNFIYGDGLRVVIQAWNEGTDFFGATVAAGWYWWIEWYWDPPPGGAGDYLLEYYCDDDPDFDTAARPWNDDQGLLVRLESDEDGTLRWFANNNLMYSDYGYAGESLGASQVGFWIDSSGSGAGEIDPDITISAHVHDICIGGRSLNFDFTGGGVSSYMLVASMVNEGGVGMGTAPYESMAMYLYELNGAGFLGQYIENPTTGSGSRAFELRLDPGGVLTAWVNGVQRISAIGSLPPGDTIGVGLLWSTQHAYAELSGYTSPRILNAHGSGDSTSWTDELNDLAGWEMPDQQLFLGTTLLEMPWIESGAAVCHSLAFFPSTDTFTTVHAEMQRVTPDPGATQRVGLTIDNLWQRHIFETSEGRLDSQPQLHLNISTGLGEDWILPPDGTFAVTKQPMSASPSGATTAADCSASPGTVWGYARYVDPIPGDLGIQIDIAHNGYAFQQYFSIELRCSETTAESVMFYVEVYNDIWNFSIRAIDATGGSTYLTEDMVVPAFAVPATLGFYTAGEGLIATVNGTTVLSASTSHALGNEFFQMGMSWTGAGTCDDPAQQPFITAARGVVVGGSCGTEPVSAAWAGYEGIGRGGIFGGPPLRPEMARGLSRGISR